MGTMTLEQAARREKRRAKRAPFHAAVHAAHVAFELEHGNVVSAHRRVAYEAWKADPTRLTAAFEAKRRELQATHDLMEQALKDAMRGAAVKALQNIVKNHGMGELRQL